jgi:glycosyltransferase involved in cell wall biosynthesis
LKLIIHATNVHQGGGRTLLVGLLSALKRPAIILLDERLFPLPDLFPEVEVITYAPSLGARLKAEFDLRKLSEPEDIVLSFGNLPPLFRSSGRVFVYLQNRYLSGSRSLKGLSFVVRLRIRMERLWLRCCLRTGTILVQTETMMMEVKKQWGYDAKVIAFLPNETEEKLPPVPSRQYDYLYVASGEPHKNHLRLLDAWINLANKGYRPSLCLTLDKDADAELWASIESLISQYDLQVFNQPTESNKVSLLYSNSAALIYPSLFESFGLPLLEAGRAGIPIIAAELDYVRDVVVPVITFDAESPLSIERAVMRHNGWEQNISPPVDAERFLQLLVQLD